MNKELLQTIGTDLLIRQMPDEANDAWARRVCYSVIGLQMLSSLYDLDEDAFFDNESSDSHDIFEATVSMQRILNRGERLAEIFKKKDDDNDFDVKKFSEKIRELYIHNGFMLHKNYRLAYPPSSFAKAGNMYLARGVPPWKAAKASGLGMLTEEISTNATPTSVEEMFNIERSTIGNWFEKFLGTFRWETNPLPQDVEWLNIHEPPTRRYWSGKPPKDGYSLYRTKSSTGTDDYFLVMVSNGIEQQYRLPTWRGVDGEYRRIAIALRTLYNNTPTVTFQKPKELTRAVTFKFDYLLPPTEQRFIELYSWCNLNDPFALPGRLERIFAIDLYETVKTILERLSYKIQELP